MGSYEVIEGIMQPKLELAKKEELMEKLLSTNLSAMKEMYPKVLSCVPNLFTLHMRKSKASRVKIYIDS